MLKATRHTPKAIVSFSTENGELTVGTEQVKIQGEIIDREVINISTNNDLQSDAGTFQITLANRKRWDKVLSSNDFVRIQMYRDNNGYTMQQSTVMMGLVDDVRRGVSIQGGTPQRTVTITGRTFAKALINFEVGVVQEVSVTPASIGWLGDRITFDGSSAAQIMRSLFDELVFKYMNYEFKNGHTFKSYSNLKLSSRPGEQLRDGNSFINYQGSMQSFFREVANEPFNQMFWECYDDGLASFVLRETPFSPENWNALPTHIVYDEDVVLDSIGRSDIESYTLFSVGIQNFFSASDVNQTLGVFPLWYEPHFKKYGLRRLHRFTGYIGWGNSEDTEETSAKLEEYQRDLYEWNILNPSFYNGYLSVRGDNKYKVGDRLLYLSIEDGRDLEFFIESVSHDFQNYGTWITKLGLTRGMPEGGKDRFETPEAATYEGGALGEVVIPPTSTGSTNNGDFILPPTGQVGTGTAAKIINYGQTFIGKTTYSFGGGRTEKDIAKGYFDCSSWIHYVFKQNGITLGSSNPANVSTTTLVKVGTPVSSHANLQPGDLIFFDTYKKNGHVGIWIGDGKWIGCQTSNGVSIESIDSGYWKSKLSSTIRRVL